MWFDVTVSLREAVRRTARAAAESGTIKSEANRERWVALFVAVPN
jgi:hypothetical protein